MTIQENVAVGSKTTMRIGGNARYYADVMTKEDVEQAWAFAKEKNIPLIPLGGGSNTIFADGTIDALVIRIKADGSRFSFDSAQDDTGAKVEVNSGKILASLINELAAQDLDLSPLTGIPGTIGGALFGNAGQGPAGKIWIDSFVESVTAFIDGQWKTLTREQCDFRYRESFFKDHVEKGGNVILWSTVLKIPKRSGVEVKDEIERLLKKRIETQPHIKTAGSCFKALPDGTPAWKLIDAAGLRGKKIGGVQIAEKHANFLLNVEQGTFNDALAVTKMIRDAVPQIAGIEMRFYAENGKLAA
jgi:UDP-N-acetylmuramate dehydrogenase